MSRIRTVVTFFIVVVSYTSFGQFTNSITLRNRIIAQCCEYIETKKSLNETHEGSVWVVTITRVNDNATKCNFSITLILNPWTLEKICSKNYYFLNDEDLLLIQFKNVDEWRIAKLSFPEIEGNLFDFVTNKVPSFIGEWFHDPDYRVVRIRNNKRTIKDYEFPLRGMPEKYLKFCN